MAICVIETGTIYTLNYIMLTLEIEPMLQLGAFSSGYNSYLVNRTISFPVSMYETSPTFAKILVFILADSCKRALEQDSTFQVT